MSNTILPCRWICCRRNPNTRLINKEISSNKIELSLSSKNEKISNKFSQFDQLYQIQTDIDLDRLTKEYLETINEYRFHLGFSSLEISNELTNQALNRATQLSIQNYVENTNPFDLIYNNEPIGEMYEDFSK